MSKDEIAMLRMRFRDRTLREAVRLRDCLEQGNFQTPEVERLAHKLVGTGGIFGFVEISATAAAVEDRFAAGEVPTREQIEALLAMMESLGPKA